MRFIGFVIEKEYEIVFEKILKKVMREIDTKVITVLINEKSIYNVKNIHFDLIIVNNNLNGIEEIIKNSKYIILNEDSVNTDKFQQLCLNIITYGFGNKCTITASSVEEDEMLICIQRTIRNIKNMQIEPQEYRIKRYVGQINEYLEMALATTKILYS